MREPATHHLHQRVFAREVVRLQLWRLRFEFHVWKNGSEGASSLACYPVLPPVADCGHRATVACEHFGEAAPGFRQPLPARHLDGSWQRNERLQYVVEIVGLAHV